MDHLYTMPGHLIRRAQQISTALFTEECAGFDLTSVQFAALTAIKANPDVDATRLSALIAFDRSTIGDVLERLEAKGWILRSASEGDRRVKLLTLTPAGRDLQARLTTAIAARNALLIRLDDAERSTLAPLLERLAPAEEDLTAC